MMTWKLDDSMTCPQCLHHNALLGPRIDPEVHYLCRDCGFTYIPGASPCSGCRNPITKRCGSHCYSFDGERYAPPPWASQEEVEAYRDWCLQQDS